MPGVGHTAPMSRAFTREPDADAAAAADVLPDRPISTHANFVTAAGLAAIIERLRMLTVEQANAQERGDVRELAVIARERRYWTARRASAQVIEPDARPTVVRFGLRVALAFADGANVEFRIVGEDEADPVAGLLSYVSPVARALLGLGVGEVANLNGREAKIVSLVVT
jgi:transcription elongation GreA/GreB family factor